MAIITNNHSFSPKFSDIPPEIWGNIAGYLTIIDALSLKSSCSMFAKFFNTGTFINSATERNWKLLALASPELKKNPGLQRLAFKGSNVYQKQLHGKKAKTLECGEETTLENLLRIPFFSTLKEVTCSVWIPRYVREALKNDKDVCMARSVI